MKVITSFMKLSWKAPTRGLEKGVKISGDTQILKIYTKEKTVDGFVIVFLCISVGTYQNL